ncbi:MAG: hypothetical protein H6747_06410 [Deltaproteobacteria bacterium]|nr:hypothetical protein [Deltaproteobacteria bacterium]
MRAPTREHAVQRRLRVRCVSHGCALWLGLGALLGCEKDQPPSAHRVELGAQTRAGRGAAARRKRRNRVAAVTIRFWNRAIEPGAEGAGFDQLRLAAVFADADPRDIHLVGALVGSRDPGRELPSADSCVIEPRPVGQPSVAPTAWMQLLDVGDLQLRAGEQTMPIAVSLVPSLFSGVRGVRYDGERDHSRGMLAHGRLDVLGSGGDGVPAFRASIAVPRPLRVSHVAGEPVRSGRVRPRGPVEDLELRWGSTDGGARRVELQLGVEGEGELRWLRCSLRDDGDFTVAAPLLSALRDDSGRRPWLLILSRSVDAEVPGFEGTPLRLELLDAVRIDPPAPIVVPAPHDHRRTRRQRPNR